MKEKTEAFFQEHVPYCDLNRGVLVTTNGSYSTGLQFKPLDIDCANADTLNDIGGSLVRLLNELSKEFTYKLIAKTDLSTGYPSKTFFLWIQKVNVRQTAISPLKTKQALQFLVSDDTEIRDSVLKEQERLIQVLQTANLEATTPTDEEILIHLKSIFRPHTLSEKPSLHSMRQADLLIKDNQFFYDHIYWSGISVAEYPDTVSTGQMVFALLNESSCFTCVIIKPCDSQKVAEDLKQKRKISASLANTSSRLRDLESEAKLHSEDDLLERLVVGQEKVFECQISSFVSGLDPQFTEIGLTRLADQFRSQGYQTYREALSLYPVFQSCLPGMPLEKTRTQLLPSSCAQATLPIFDTDKGHPKPIIYFSNQYGARVGIDPWDESLPSYNTVISGTSGSGKSFLSNVLLKKLSDSEEVSIFIIDIGGSYRRLTSIKGGQYFTFDVNGKNGFNPLGGLNAKDPASLEACTEIISTIISEPDIPITKTEKSILLQELTDLSLKFEENIRLSDLRNEWLKSKIPFLKNAAGILYGWTGDRPYGRLLDNHTLLEPSSKWSCFDLRGLNDHQELQRVVMLAVVKRVWDIVRYSENKKLLLLDEVWALIQSQSGFIGEAFRTFRKHNAAAIAVTQSLEDIATEALTSAVLNNSPTKIILKQSLKPERLQKLLDLNSKELEIVSSLRSIKGSFSEFFMINGDKRRFLRLTASSEDYWISTTNAQDIEFIGKFMKTRCELTELQACREIAKLYGRSRP